MARKPVRRRRKSDPSDGGDAPSPEAQAPAEAAPEAAAEAPQDRKKGRRRRWAKAATTERKPKPSKPKGPPPTSSRLTELESFASMGDLDMGELLGAAPLATQLPDPGTRVTGTVSRIAEDEVTVELGLRVEGFIATAAVPDVEIGQTLEAFVVAADDHGVLLSQRVSGEAAEAMLEDAVDSGVPVEGVVLSRNRGGYEVKVGSVRAFCPISQFSRVPQADPDAPLGETLSFRVLEVDEKVILSRRALEEEEAAEARKAFWATAGEGDRFDGVVTSVQPWGVFVDIGGVEGLLPRREASWGDVGDLTSRFARGQRLSVQLLDLDPENDRITFTAKDAANDPWNDATTTFPPGSVVSGRAVSQTDFGVFVDVGLGLQGLIHISRLGSRMPEVGDEIEVRVLSVDPDRRRLELAPGDFDPEAQAANSVGTEVKGEVTEVTRGGVRVRLEDGRSAWLPEREVPLEPGTVLAQRYRAGHEVSARIVSDDRGRVTLSCKPDDTSERSSWRESLAKADARGGMGTLGDLLGGLKR